MVNEFWITKNKILFDQNWMSNQVEVIYIELTYSEHWHSTWTEKDITASSGEQAGCQEGVGGGCS